MSAHTKGPWVVEAGGPRLVNTHACVISAADGLGPVAYSTREYARLIAAAPDLLEALQAHQAAQAMPIYGDYSGFVWPKVEMRKPGETAWGWICEKHGLGYQGGCICCSDEWKRHQDDKDRAARYARDDALHEASNKARAAIAKATGEAA